MRSDLKEIVTIDFVERKRKEEVELVTYYEREGRGKKLKHFFVVYDNEMREQFRAEITGDRGFFKTYYQMLEALRNGFVELDKEGNIVQITMVQTRKLEEKPKQYTPRRYYTDR